MSARGSFLHYARHLAVFAVISALVPMGYPTAVAAASPIVTDTFTRTVSGGWGSAALGGAYALSGGNAAFSVNGSVGGMSLPKAGATRSAVLSPTARDVDMTFRVRANRPVGGRLFIYAISRRAAADEYRSKVIISANGSVQVHASRFIGGSEATLGTEVTVSGLTQATGVFIRVRTQVTGANPTTIRVKAWADAAAEPVAWQFTATDSSAALQQAGRVGLMGYLQSSVTNAPSNIGFDDLDVQSLDTSLPAPPDAEFSWAEGADWTTVDFTDKSTQAPTAWTWDFGDGGTSTQQNPSHTYAMAGTYTVSLTATNDEASDTVAHHVEVVEPGPPPTATVVAADAFGRAASGTWRVADTGGLYSYAGPLGDFSVDGSTARMRLATGGASRSAFLYDVLARDLDMSFVTSADKRPVGSLYVYAALRRENDGSSYRAKVRVAPDGSVFVHASRFVNGSESPIGTETRVNGLVFNAGTRLRMHAQATGAAPTTIRVRAWVDGDPEPSAWQYTGSDSTAALQAPGTLGFISYVTSAQSGAIVVSFDDLLVTSESPVTRVSGATFVGAGDISLCSNDGDEATARLLDMIPGTVFTAGDNAQLQATAAEFANCFEPTWGRHKSRIHPAIGNHEYLAAPDAAPYFDYFGAAAGERAKGWYAYDVGSWRVYVLNGNCGILSCSVGSEQEQWLRTDLAANPRTCALAVWHQPRWSSGSRHGSTPATQPFWQALYDAGAEIVIGGHDHDYERFMPMNASGASDPANGIRQFVVGTGGTALRSLAADPLPTTEVRQATAHGVLKLVLGANEYEWVFIPIAGQAFTDRGSGSCH